MLELMIFFLLLHLSPLFLLSASQILLAPQLIGSGLMNSLQAALGIRQSDSIDDRVGSAQWLVLVWGGGSVSRSGGG